MHDEQGTRVSSAVASRRRHRLPAAVSMSLVVTALGVGALMAGAQTTTPTAPEACVSGTPTSASTSDLCVGIGEYDIYFKPNLVTIPADEGVRVVLHNSGAALHNFSVTAHENTGLKDLAISVNIDPGATEETTINAPAGEYYFFCDQPGHEAAGMRGYLTVKADATIETSEATVTPRAG